MENGAFKLHRLFATYIFANSARDAVSGRRRAISWSLAWARVARYRSLQPEKMHNADHRQNTTGYSLGKPCQIALFDSIHKDVR